MTEKQIDSDSLVAPVIFVGRAVDYLRRQGGCVLTDGSREMAIKPVETIEAGWFSTLPKTNRLLILSGARAKYIGLANDSSSPVQIDATALSLAQLQSLADPLADKAALPKLSVKPADEIHCLALNLAKYASLLPAMLLWDKKEAFPDDHIWPRVDAKDIKHYIDFPIIDIAKTAEAKLPLTGAEHATLMSFRSRYATSVHLVLAISDIAKEASPIVRIHSSCVTGDILGSLRCDCGDQLHMALEAMIAEGSGLLIYLHQEGRGIGITNKLRAYALQEQGVDTYDANLMLGYEEDERDFALAAGILKQLGYKRIRLMTNNPHKIDALKSHGIEVTERVPLAAKGSAHNHAYIEAKIKKSGHLF